MSKCATVVVDIGIDEQEWSILDVKPHENSIEAKAYTFDEILRLAEDFSENGEVTVKLFEDCYGEECIKISCDESKIVVKTMFEKEETDD